MTSGVVDEASHEPPPHWPAASRKGRLCKIDSRYPPRFADKFLAMRPGKLPWRFRPTPALPQSSHEAEHAWGSHISPRLCEFRPCGSRRTPAALGHALARFGQDRPTFDKMWLVLAKLGQTSPQMAVSGEMKPSLPNAGHCWSNFVKACEVRCRSEVKVCEGGGPGNADYDANFTLVPTV